MAMSLRSGKKWHAARVGDWVKVMCRDVSMHRVGPGVHCMDRSSRKTKAGKMEGRLDCEIQNKDGRQEQQAGARNELSMQEEGKKSGTDKWWARRCELERRIERRGKMIENVDKLLEAIGMSMMKEAGNLHEEKKKIRGEVVKLRREIRKVDGEVRRAEGIEDADKARKEAKRAKAEKKREEEEEEWGMAVDYGD